MHKYNRFNTSQVKRQPFFLAAISIIFSRDHVYEMVLKDVKPRIIEIKCTS